MSAIAPQTAGCKRLEADRFQSATRLESEKFDG